MGVTSANDPKQTRTGLSPSPGTLFHLPRCDFAIEVPMLQHAQSYEHPKYVDLDIGMWAIALGLLAGLAVIAGLTISGTL
jgi:hypothetical protein